MSNLATAQFNFYGFIVRESAALAERVDDIRFDFSYFATEQDNAPADLALHFHSDSEWPPLPSVAASLHTPRNIVFRDGDTSYLDYGGRGLVVNTQNGKHFDIYCDDRDLAHEIGFLAVLSSRRCFSSVDRGISASRWAGADHFRFEFHCADSLLLRTHRC